MTYRSYSDLTAIREKWIGKIPSHWKAERMKFCFTEKKPVKNEALPPGAISFGKAIIKDQEKLIAETRDTYQEVLTGEYIVNPINLNYDLTSLRTALSKVDICVSPAYIILKAQGDKIDKEYGAFFLHVFDISHMKSLGAGVRQTINFKDIGECLCLLPPMDEQRHIASYLNQETSRIDTLIAKKTRFIELLKEKRQAIITKAVTKGLDDSVEMKDSGVEWVGQTPAAWEVKRLRWSVIGCVNGIWGNEPDGSSDVVVIRVADFDRDRRSVSLGNPTKRSITSSEREGRLLKKGDLLIEKSGGGDNQPVGMVVIYEHDEEAVCSNFVAKMTPANGYDPHYLKFLHQTFYQTRLPIRSIKQSTGIQNLDSKSYLDEYASFPPYEEQTRISKWLMEATCRIDDLISKTERSIELLKEKRSALITAAVTGKIDVREAA